jgi:hypothetical protein
VQPGPETVRSVHDTSDEEPTVPLHTPTGLAPRLGRVVALAAASCASAGAVTIASADDQPVPQVHTIAEPSQPMPARYFDIEANKAASMRALGFHMAEQRANRSSRYQDLEANKAASMRAR